MADLVNALTQENKNLTLIQSLIQTSDLTYINEKKENALLLTIHHGLTLEAIEILKKPNNGIEQVDYLGNSVLILALKKYYDELALIILQKGFKNINHIDKAGDCALGCAFRYGFDKVSNYLLDIENINVNHIDKHGDSILIIAVDHLREEPAMKMVSKFNVNMNYINKHGFDAITLCITKRLRKLANLLLDKGVNTEHVSNVGDNALLYALNNDFYDVAQKIVNNNKDNSTINSHGDVAFFHAILKGQEDIAKDMLAKGTSNFELINSDNNSSLILSLTNDMFSLSYLLVKYGSENFVKHINKNFDSALFLAMNKGEWHLVYEIINKKYYDINMQNTEGDTTLLLSINFGIEELCLKMFDDNIDIIDVNVINNDGNTLLICALICGMKELSIRILKKIDIHNLNFKNKYNDNALMICINLQYYDIIDKILNIKNAEVHVVNQYGDTPLILLLAHNQPELAKKLITKHNYQYLDYVSNSGLSANNLLKNFPGLI